MLKTLLEKIIFWKLLLGERLLNIRSIKMERPMDLIFRGDGGFMKVLFTDLLTANRFISSIL